MARTFGDGGGDGFEESDEACPVCGAVLLEKPRPKVFGNSAETEYKCPQCGWRGDDRHKPLGGEST